MRLLLLCILGFILVPTTSYADKNAKNLMQQVVKNYVGLIPYIYGNEPENPKDISKKLRALRNAFQSSKHSKILSAPNFAPLAESMRESFQEIHTHYNTNYDDYSKYRLLRLMSHCVACHSQLPKARFNRVHNKYKSITNKYIKQDEDKAYLSFFFRDYKKAACHLKNILNKNKDKSALSKLIKVYLVNLDDKEGALNVLKSVAQDNIYETKLQKIARKWAHELSTNQLTRGRRTNKQSWVRILISKYLIPRKNDLLDLASNDSVMISYQMQRILYNYLVYHPNSALTPDLLYWLGILENRERGIDLYTLGEMYFEQCINKYPESYIASSCYQAYKNAVYEGFTGSSGTHVPQEYINKLKIYKKLIQKEDRLK